MPFGQQQQPTVVYRPLFRHSPVLEGGIYVLYQPLYYISHCPVCPSSKREEFDIAERFNDHISDIG